MNKTIWNRQNLASIADGMQVIAVAASAAHAQSVPNGDAFEPVVFASENDQDLV
jgi:hypothetical protein